MTRVNSPTGVCSAVSDTCQTAARTYRGVTGVRAGCGAVQFDLVQRTRTPRTVHWPPLVVVVVSRAQELLYLASVSADHVLATVLPRTGDSTTPRTRRDSSPCCVLWHAVSSTADSPGVQ